jgi:hypothetical protein
MQKRRVMIPESIPATGSEGQVIKDETGKQAILRAAEYYLGKLRDPWFGSGSDAYIAISNLRPRLKKAKPGDAFDVDEDDWQLMCMAIKQPKSQPTIQGMLTVYEVVDHFIVFNNAWLDAGKTNVSDDDDEKGSAAKVVRKVTRR